MSRNIFQGMLERLGKKKKASLRRRYWSLFGLRLFSRGLLIFMVCSILVILPFRWLPPPTSSFMLQDYFQNTQIGQTDSPVIRYRWVSYENISSHMALAVVAAEDQKFPLHGGFDFEAIRLALQDKIEGKPLRGASTISQQVVKNLYLWPDRSLLRKGLEAWLTMLMEVLWSKQRILEVYLNIAQFGDRTFGVEAASQRFFAKPASRLSREEAALLAAVLPSPARYWVDSPSNHVLWRQAWILKQMRQLGGLRYLGQL